MLRPVYTNQFKKDFKKAIRRGMKEEKLVDVINMLCRGETLPEANRDHKLVNSRNYRNVRECHIEPDWLLIYQINQSFSPVIAQCCAILVVQKGMRRSIPCR